MNEVIGSRIGMTFFIAMLAFVVCWGFAIPVGILVAVKQYSVFDYFFTFLGFIGLAVPGFLLALVLMYISFSVFGLKVGGLFSPDMITAPWSWAKVDDFLGHIWLPVIILAIGGTANLIRTLRATMLDELRKQYVTVARAKGLSELKVLLALPGAHRHQPDPQHLWLAAGVVLLRRYGGRDRAQPGYRRSGVVARLDDTRICTRPARISCIVGALTTVGSLVSDLLLAAIDPRIRFGELEAS